jgi:L-2,4-diaminobutyrate decarboxylase
MRTHFAGIEHADSVVWDAHKMLLMPAPVTGVLYRRREHAHLAFTQHVSYLFDERAHADSGTRTFECTKRAMGVTTYAGLRMLGDEAVRTYLERVLSLTRAFAAELESAPDFELATAPQANIVCFRLLGEGSEDERAARGRAIRHAVVEGGSHYLVETTLRDRHYFRATIVHPGTTLDDLRNLLVEIRRHAGAASPPPENHGRNAS